MLPGLSSAEQPAHDWRRPRVATSHRAFARMEPMRRRRREQCRPRRGDRAPGRGHCGHVCIQGRESAMAVAFRQKSHDVGRTPHGREDQRGHCVGGLYQHGRRQGRYQGEGLPSQGGSGDDPQAPRPPTDVTPGQGDARDAGLGQTLRARLGNVECAHGEENQILRHHVGHMELEPPTSPATARPTATPRSPRTPPNRRSARRRRTRKTSSRRSA